MNSVRWLTGLLVTLFLVLQYQLWLGQGGLMSLRRMQQNIDKQKVLNAQYKKRNDEIMANIEELKKGHQAVEARARNDLGMVKKGEVLYQVVK